MEASVRICARCFVKKAIEIRGIEQVRQETMSFFERLKTEASAEWRAYTEHPFTNGLADGSLAETAFRHYLVQDYLFLIEFSRCAGFARALRSLRSTFVSKPRMLQNRPISAARRRASIMATPSWS
jgi:TENA/THI-4/PQQC family